MPRKENRNAVVKTAAAQQAVLQQCAAYPRAQAAFMFRPEQIRAETVNYFWALLAGARV